MKRAPRYTRQFAAWMVGGAMLCRASFGAGLAADLAARVNGAPITRAAVQEIVEGMQALGQKGASDTPGRGDDRKRALESLIGLELLYEESQSRGVNVPDEAIDAEIARTKQHFANDQAYKEALRDRHLSAADVRRETRRTMAVNRLLEGVIWKDIRIAEEQIADFYQRHRNEFQHPPEVRARHILIRVAPSAPAADKQRALRQATELRAVLQHGADFADVARQSSEDRATAAHGGDLGYFAAGELQPDFEAAVQSLPLHSPSQPVLTDLGYHIIEVTDRRAAGVESLEAVRDQIRAVLLKREKQNRQTALVEELRAKAQIEYAPGWDPQRSGE